MKSLEKIEKQIKTIEEQNQKEDEELAWKRSNFRKLVLSTFVFIIIGFTLQLNNYPNAWFNGFIAAVGFFILFFLFGVAQTIWGKHIYKN